MKKTAIAAVLVLCFSAMVFGCGDPKTPGRDERLIEVEGLAETYYPNLERLDAENAEEVLAGKVDVDLIFGTTLDGWKAVADAYSRLQPGVSVELHDHSDSTYNESVTNAARDDSTDWDIFHGNRLGTRLNAVGYNFRATTTTRGSRTIPTSIPALRAPGRKFWSATRISQTNRAATPPAIR